jgi:hypothetical protein
MKKSNNLGGKREGAGRPKGELKIAVGQRVPLRFHKKIVKVVKKEVEKLTLIENNILINQ